jgi:hypothetical protein
LLLTHDGGLGEAFLSVDVGHALITRSRLESSAANKPLKSLAIVAPRAYSRFIAG